MKSFVLHTLRDLCALLAVTAFIFAVSHAADIATQLVLLWRAA